MAIKFYCDEHIHPAIVNALRRRGVDILTAQEEGMLGVSDEKHLRFAVSQIGEFIQGLILIYRVVTEEEMENRVEYI